MDKVSVSHFKYMAPVIALLCTDDFFCCWVVGAKIVTVKNQNAGAMVLVIFNETV